MILNRQGKPYPQARMKRMEWLLKHKNKYKLGNYPWGLSRLDNISGVKLFQRELTIIIAMRAAGLFSDKTHVRDINLNNLIVDALSAERQGRYIPEDKQYREKSQI